MVLGVCRRMLGDDHAAADAFQAVFLVLARKAPSVRVDDSLGRWLHGVSVRVARRARAVDARRTGPRRRPWTGSIRPTSPRRRILECGYEVRAAIDEEIARLPGRYRSAVVLCYLEGLTQEQAARRLRCPVGTIQSRLHRARERLRPALARRGLAPAAWSAATLARAERAPGVGRRDGRRGSTGGRHARPGRSRPPSPGWRDRRSGGWLMIRRNADRCAAMMTLGLDRDRRGRRWRAGATIRGRQPAAPKPPGRRSPARRRPDPSPSMAERLAGDPAPSTRPRLDDLDRALEKASDPREQNAMYTNDVARRRRVQPPDGGPRRDVARRPRRSRCPGLGDQQAREVRQRALR